MNQTSAPQKIQWGPLLISIAIPVVIGITASIFTRPEIDGWYRALNKPSFTPPDWLFAPVWTILYIMIGISAYLVWEKRDDSITFTKARPIYVMQLIFNFLWSWMFFNQHNPLGGLVIIIILLILIISNIFYFKKFSITAAWLLVPYLLWVSFATALNYAIVALNYK
ncbi:tryptophan-rich sensory protein [Mucilaginibacter limnophilus]|uniref:Tryptophan-rich sensory protein n=1 Tax=Mucilaginibacter limnophilus TaxID=1932778 RepID=A0A437MHX0_9SPHI|nr:TspO/MBR family protein [Mucilaginibacter limnophilus]RVT97232.1 tryptophan-rich sensory protein [Mucilaginibacter limnophilus]